MTPPVTTEALVEAPYVLLKRGLFERLGHHGYTGVLRHAGRFSHEEASACAVYGVTMMLASEAPDYSPACWHETQVEDLRDLLRIEREAKEAALAAHQQVTAERDRWGDWIADSIEILNEACLVLGADEGPGATEPGIVLAVKRAVSELATANAELARLRAEGEAAAYLIDRLQACHEGRPVRDLPEATSAYQAARAATAREG